jgi:4-amino-4-deoxy-L-arabinose transferase-like glycosyltransferase
MTTSSARELANATPAPPPPAHRNRLERLLRGNPADPSWARPALLALLTATTVLYAYGLSRSGYANEFYSAAAQAGAHSWKGWFFGSLDSANSITVDKPPASLWVMGLSVRLFGLSSWSILLPEALMGVASVGILYSTVRKVTRSALSGLLAGAILATTPVAVLMFRFNNPDALLVLLMVAAAAATVHAIAVSDPDAPGGDRAGGHSGGRAVRWLAVAGALIGLAFLTKMLQAFLVVPGFAAGYLIAAHGTAAQRIRHLLVGLFALIVSGGWYIALVEWWPFGSRPYIGGSQHNSIIELTLGYNGLGRLTGSETGSVGGGRFGGWGSTGALRMFNSEIGGQVSWLLPGALLVLVAGLWAMRRRPRTDLMRAALVLWGTWLIVTAATFSFMGGIFHPYYTVALAPAIGACAAIGLAAVGRFLPRRIGDAVIGSAVVLSSWWAFRLLDRSSTWHPWLRWSILLIGVTAGLALMASRLMSRQIVAALVLAGFAAVAAGPASYTVQTASSAETGSIPSAGPQVAGGFGGPGGAPPRGAFPLPGLNRGTTPQTGPLANRPFGNRPFGNRPFGNRPFGNRAGPPTAGGMGGLLDGSRPTAAMQYLLTSNAGDYTWVAATVGAQNAAGYQLATNEPVMAIGGFNGSDPSPTLAQFKQYVARHAIHYYIGGGGLGRGGIGGSSGSTSSEIEQWVVAHFTAKTVGGVSVYDLTTRSGS